MSLEKKDLRLKMSDDMLNRLRILAGLDNNDVAEHGAMLLEKAIVGEFHAVSVQMDRAKRLGLTGNNGD